MAPVSTDTEREVELHFASPLFRTGGKLGRTEADLLYFSSDKHHLRRARGIILRRARGIIAGQQSYDPAERPVPQYPQGQWSYPQQPHHQQTYGQQPSYSQGHPYGQQDSPQRPQQPPPGRHTTQEPLPERPRKDPWIVRHKVLSIIIAAAALLFAVSIGAAARGGKDAKASTAPTVTVTATTVVATPGPTVTATATVQATQNVYVIGQDIPGGTWHTSGSPSGGNCYYALLRSTDTNDIIDNKTSPDRNGGCEQLEGAGAQRRLHMGP